MYIYIHIYYFWFYPSPSPSSTFSSSLIIPRHQSLLPTHGNHHHYPFRLTNLPLTFDLRLKKRKPLLNNNQEQ